VRILRDDNNGDSLVGRVGTVLPLGDHRPPWGYVVLEVIDGQGEKAVWYVHRRHLLVLPEGEVE
jgi:hypothetical protein